MPTTPMDSRRSAGILLHPTSLPGPYGIGDLGPTAYAWVDALVRARQTWWQILPLGPTGFGDSPYQCFSAFAGNTNLISPEALIQAGLVKTADLPAARFPADHVDFNPVRDFKEGLLALAWKNFQAGAAPALKPAFDAFVSRQAGWLDDFALFMALKEAHEHRSWYDWPTDLVRRRPQALRAARQELGDAVGRHRFGQFLFDGQWQALKEYAHGKGVRLIGDLPIFIAADSVDVWANPTLFQLDSNQRPRVVAGVPPDYFAATGQLWGNPLYNWEALKQTGYAWWAARLRAALDQVDLVRLDHFRGFEAYWEIPAGNPTAEFGRWVKGPGADFLAALRKTLGGLPLIAEDLGVITPEVEALRLEFNLPGMRVLQFAFGGAVERRFLPHSYDRNEVAYTGTHDNNTTRGWYENLTDAETVYLHRYAPWLRRETVAWDMIRLAWMSVADWAVAPLQDVLSLGTEARMNIPGRGAGNWRWRFTADMLKPELLDRLADVTEVYERSGTGKPGSPGP